MSEYINKDETVTILERLRDRCGNDDMAFALNWAADTVKSMSAADVEEVKHGEWIDTGSGQKCSVCGEIQYGYDSYRHRCSCCGAKMDKEGSVQ